jgi:membrane protein
MALIGLLFLIFVATTLFKVIRNSLHDIWDIRLRRTGFLFDLKVRGRSLAIILTAGILFLAASIIDVARVVAEEYIGRIWQTGSVFITNAINEITSVLVTTIWFIVLFRFLANARPSWRVATVGGILTGVLFYIGRTVLSSLMTNSTAGVIYGAGTAIVLILLFVFYSSFILYFGASFIKEYSQYMNDPIVPSAKAYHFHLEETAG